MPRTTEKASVSLRDVAREAGVSLATASRSLSGGPRTVRADARERVLEAVRRLGYRPNLTAQATAKGTTKTVAVVVSDIQDPYYSTIAQGAIESAGAAGLIVTIAGSGQPATDGVTVVQALRGLSPQMIILAGSRSGTIASREKLVKELQVYQARGGRVVVVGQEDLPFDTVALGYRKGAGDLADALASRGYRHPVLLGPPAGPANSNEWQTGFIEAARKRDIDIDDNNIHRSSLTRDGAYATVRRLAHHGLGSTDVLVAASDLMAIGAMSALRDSGIDPGKGIAVAGFDNVVGAEDVTPQLTTVDLGLSEAGAAAVSLGLQASQSRRTHHTPHQLIIRDSTPAQK